MNHTVSIALTLSVLLLATPAVGHRVEDQREYQLAAHNALALNIDCPDSFPGICLGGVVWTAQEIEALHPFTGTFSTVEFQVTIVDEVGHQVEGRLCIDQDADGTCHVYDGWEHFCGTSRSVRYAYEGADLLVFVGGPVFHSIRALTPIGGDTCDPMGIGGTSGHVELAIHEDV